MQYTVTDIPKHYAVNTNDLTIESNEDMLPQSRYKNYVNSVDELLVINANSARVLGR